jgi:hypothetical protein
MIQYNTNIFLYFLFIVIFIVFVIFTLLSQNKKEGMDESIYNRQYTLKHYNWDEINDQISKYETLLSQYKQRYPIVWNVGKISTSSYITQPTISVNQSSSLPNVYLDITFPYPMDGERGLLGEPGNIGIDGLIGNPGPIGEQGIPYPCGNYNY